MVNHVEMTLVATLDDLKEEIEKKKEEMGRRRGEVGRAHAAFGDAERYAQGTDRALRVLDEELDFVVGLYNRDRMEWLVLRIDELRAERELIWSELAWAANARWNRQQDLDHAQAFKMA